MKKVKILSSLRLQNHHLSHQDSIRPEVQGEERGRNEEGDQLKYTDLQSKDRIHYKRVYL